MTDSLHCQLAEEIFSIQIPFGYYRVTLPLLLDRWSVATEEDGLTIRLYDVSNAELGS